MNQINSMQQLWDEFLAEWPLERIKTMTLQEYVSTQDKTTFTYWLETKTQPLANIKGSPSPKFGIYKRNSEPKERSGMAHGSEYSWWEKLGSTEQEAFETVRSEIVRVINAARVGDLMAIDSVKLAPVYKWKIAFMYQVQSVPTIVNIFAKDKLSELAGLPKSSSYPELYRSLMNNYDTEQYANIAEYGRMCWSQLELLDNEEQPSNEPLNTSVGNTLMSPLNQILYGPPGTGKTYHTIEAAVTAAEPTFGWANRSELKEKYDQLVADKRIRFVTFHQSYGYEEFVEGIAARTVEGHIDYFIKDGIFKSICNDVLRVAVADLDKPEPNFELLVDTLKQYEREGTALHTKEGKQFIIANVSETSIRVQPVGAESTKNVNIERLKAYIETRDDESIKNNSPAYTRGITYEYDRLNSSEAEQASKNYVLLIDEINRGNISKIFGELITLIEDSKRSGKGQTETVEVVLPHSGEKFSVPNNLYIIGTMNTADRSLAMMDTALRRRFDFVEMMPKPELLENVMLDWNGSQIDLTQLLAVLNERIEILYDREHTLGHAFFMPVKALVDEGKHDKAFTTLVSVFKNKIIPLLEEYFFEDWSKIRMVLADNQKKDTNLQFVQEHKQTKQELDYLFGRSHNLGQYGQEVVKYTLSASNDEVWSKPDAYIGIYQTKEKPVTGVTVEPSEVEAK